MKRVKKRIFSGVVCEQIVYSIGDRADVKSSKLPRIRFKNEEERKAHRDGIARRRHARMINDTFVPGDLYVTLTFDDEHEVHDFKTAKRIRDNYIRRLKYACPDARITAYLGRGKSTKRIHMHMLAAGVPAEIVENKWNCGGVKLIVPLRAHNTYNGRDYGADFTALANYLFNHWDEEQGGHRYKKTSNVRVPEGECPVEVKTEYSLKRAPRAPKGYELVESVVNPYGFLVFKYIKTPPKSSRKAALKKSL